MNYIMSAFTEDITMDIEIVDFEGHKEVTITVMPELESSFESLIAFLENRCELHRLHL